LEWSTAALVAVLMSAVSILWLHYQTQLSVAQNQHSQRVENALLEARASFQAASSATIGQKAPWTAARAAAMHLKELLALQPANSSITDAARQYLEEYQAGEADRRLAEQVEDVVIKSATQSDLGSWQQMDREFRDLFLNEGIDPESMSPAEVANRIRIHRSSQKLCDAFELWIGTKGQIGAISDSPATQEQMKPLSEAMLAADDDPVRYGIRHLLYSGKRVSKEDVDAVTADSDLATLSPRTLSWLATMYLLAEAPEAMDRIFYFAIDRYPDDFMLSFDFAYSLESQKRWSESIRYFLRCTALRPDVAGVWRGLGNAYHHNKELSRAHEALLKASELAPHHAETKVDYANVLLDLEKYEEAESLVRRSIELGCNLPQAHYCLALTMFHQERVPEALVALEKCKEANRVHPRQSVNIEELTAKCRESISVEQK
jgi:serine/threonine-protein kinase